MMAIGQSRKRISKQWKPSVWELLVVCVVCVGFIIFGQWVQNTGHRPLTQMQVAAQTMDSAISAIAAHRQTVGPAIDLGTDINGTGLIGAFFTPMTTTTGNLESKRTTTNPNMAGLIVSLLLDAGVQQGELVAVGASGSFPALLLATCAAADALELPVSLILSLGSSQFGANIAGFTWIDMVKVLADAGLPTIVPAAFSLGGDLDIARDLSTTAREWMQEIISETDAIFIYDADLASNVSQRMGIYRQAAQQSSIGAFVNIGGSWANLGIDSSVLAAPPGLMLLESLPEEEKRGVIHQMQADGVPVIHLLNMRELTQRYGLPWDPSPLPQPGEGMAKLLDERSASRLIALIAVIVAILWLVSVLLRRKACQSAVSSSS